MQSFAIYAYKMGVPTEVSLRRHEYEKVYLEEACPLHNLLYYGNVKKVCSEDEIILKNALNHFYLRSPVPLSKITVHLPDEWQSGNALSLPAAECECQHPNGAR